jgi:hypothetical protein
VLPRLCARILTSAARGVVQSSCRSPLTGIKALIRLGERCDEKRSERDLLSVDALASIAAQAVAVWVRGGVLAFFWQPMMISGGRWHPRQEA